MASDNGDFAQPLANQISQQPVTISNTGVGMKDVQNNGVQVDVATRSKLNFIGTNAISDDSAGDAVIVKLCDRGTSFPSSPNDQDEYAYLADATAGVVWRFKYNSGSASTNKWEFVGGSPMTATIATLESTTSTTYTDLSTTGPSVVVPLAGDYLIEEHANGSNGTTGDGYAIAAKLGSTATSDSQSAAGQSDHNNNNADVDCLHRRLTPQALAAGATVKLQYRAIAGGTAFFMTRDLLVVPVRVAG